MRKNNVIRLQKYIAILMVLVLLLPIASAIDYPKLTEYVTDNANIIDNDYEQKITNLADSINKNTTVEIAVLTIESLEGDSIDNYAVNTFRKSGVGKKDNNNGLLILVSKNDRKYRFEVGYGLEGTIPDAMKVPIGDKIITPNFKQGEYGKGIYESMIAIEALVTNNTEVLSKYGLASSNSGSGGSGESGISGGEYGIFFIMLLIMIGVFVVIFIAGMNKDRVRPPSLPTTYRQPPYTISSGSSTRSTSRSSSGSNRSSSRSSYSSHSGSRSGGSRGGFGGFGGGRSGGGGFGGGW